MQLGRLDVYEEFQGYSCKTLRNAPYMRQWVTIGLQNRGSEDRQAGRLERALRNFVETFPLFAAAILIAHVTNAHSWMTEWGVQLYFGARVAYLALYAAGVFLSRSLVWNVATLGIAMVLLSLV
jgi:uncharacterized MAPEG superfamily protein